MHHSGLSLSCPALLWKAPAAQGWLATAVAGPRLLRALGLGLLALAWAAAAPAADTVFKVATVVPEGTDWIRTMRSGSDEIETRTDGRVAFKFYTGAVQGNDTQVRRKMRVGQLHGGVFTAGGLAGFQKDQGIYGLPMVFRDLDEVQYVRSQLDATLAERMEQAGYVHFGVAGGGFAYLLSKRPVSSLEDMSGLKIWIPENDEVATRASRALGISPVTLPLTDVLTGLQTDLIDTVMGPPIGVLVMQWHTVVTHITDARIAYTYAALVLDGRAFGRISAADQAVVREVMGRIYRDFDTQGMADNREALQALLDDGLQRVEPAQGQLTRWRQRIAESNQKVASSGLFDPALFEAMNCYLAAYREGRQAEPGCSP